MTSQLIKNWNDYYVGELVPQWEDMAENSEFCDLVLQYANSSMRILELGAGLGYNAMYLAANGLSITASDISENAVDRCRNIAQSKNVKIHSKVIDIFGCMGPDKYNLIYDKGCWHTFFDPGDRKCFASCVAGILEEDGIWISSCGSADHRDADDDPNVVTYPRFCLLDIAIAAEQYFEIFEIRKGIYGKAIGRDFKTWECVFRKRANKAVQRSP